MIVVGFPNQWQTIANGPTMNKFISVSAYDLRFPYGGHFKNLATFRPCNKLATGSQPMIVVGIPNQWQTTAIRPRKNKFISFLHMTSHFGTAAILNTWPLLGHAIS